MKVIHSYIEPILRDALSRKHLNVEENKDAMPETLLDHLIQITDGSYFSVGSEYLTQYPNFSLADLKLIRDEMLKCVSFYI